MEQHGDYVSLDLAGVATATVDVLDTRARPPGGDVALHGIPFGVAGGDEPRFVLLEPGGTMTSAISYALSGHLVMATMPAS